MSDTGTAVPRVLIVEDQDLLREALSAMLQKQGYATTAFAKAGDALAALRQQSFDLSISELMMPDMDGVAFIKAAAEIDPDLVPVIITGDESLPSAVDAIQNGAFDYVVKPLPPSVMPPVVSRALGVRRLRQEKRQAEELLRERTAELEQAYKELDGLAYSVSHDLRAPLRAIRGFSSILAEEYAAEFSADARELLDHVLEGAAEMELLLQDLLQLCRIGRQPLSKGLVEMTGLVNDVLDDLRTEQPERQVEIELQEICDAPGDRRLLKQAFLNLLSNAFKFTRDRERAVIQIGCAPDKRENVYFVRDNGAGFNMEYADKLFKPFQRLHRKEEFEGNGAGLAIVQRIINRHGGRIWAEATPGSGACFFFTLPAEAASE
jgi:signal transduction histidine kinase